MKKENVYINLQGKSEAELTELYWVLKNNNQKLARPNLEDFLGYRNHSSYYVLSYDGFTWSGDDRFDKQQVTIQQLKEILQPMESKEFDKLLTYAKSVDFKVSDLTAYINEVIPQSYYEQLEGDEPEDKAHLFVLKYKYNNLTLTEQLEKAEAEVKRLKEAIEEESKPKIGDWLKRGTKIFKVDNTHCLGQLKKDVQLEKIQDQELINKLNELIK